MVKIYSLSLIFIFLFHSDILYAQFPYFNSFKESDLSGIVKGGDAKLTSGGVDPAGEGVLRLTESEFNRQGYVYITNDFPSNKGLKVEFEYFTWGGNNADGITFFLYDPSGGFEQGQFGGALGYAQNANSATGQGMKGGFLAIGLDEYGNFGVAAETRNGGFLDQNGMPYTTHINGEGLVAVRGGVGPNGERFGPTAYPFIGGKIVKDVYGGQTPLATQMLDMDDRFSIGSDLRSTSESQPGYRKVRFDFFKKPGVNTGYIVNVDVFVGLKGRWIKVLNNVEYLIDDSRIPATLRGGFSASTGNQRNTHEIRNVLITPSALTLNKPLAVNDNVSALINQPKSVSVLANDNAAINTNGIYQSGSVDLDPATPSIDATKTVPGGVFSVDAAGIVTFTPNVNFVGDASVDYTFRDNYSITSNSAIIKFSFTGGTEPMLSDVVKTGKRNKVLTFAGADFISRFTDADGHVLTKVKIVTLPLNGTLKLNGTDIAPGQEIETANLANITFVPAAGWNGVTVFDWNGFDGIFYALQNAKVTITINETLPPLALNDAAGTEPNKSVEIVVLNNDQARDFDIDPSSVELVQPANGQVQVNALGEVIYTPRNAYTGSDNFRYRVKDLDGNWSDFAAVSVTVSGLLFANVLTPNGDGKNDVFTIVGLEEYDTAELTIFNRWGNEVFRGSNYKNTWNGHDLNAGTYYYLVKLTKGAHQDLRKGWILIKR